MRFYKINVRKFPVRLDFVNQMADEYFVPELTPGAITRRSRQQARDGITHKFFRRAGTIVLCKWSGKWTQIGELPAGSTLTKAKADQIIASVKGQSAAGAATAAAGPAPPVADEDIEQAFRHLKTFVDEFQAIATGTAAFAFNQTHNTSLAQAEAATVVLENAAKGSPHALFCKVFGNHHPGGADASPPSETGELQEQQQPQPSEQTTAGGTTGGEQSTNNTTAAATASLTLADEGYMGLCAASISLLTGSMDNVTALDKSEYDSKVLLTCARIRLHLLQALRRVASTAEANQIIARLSNQRLSLIHI